jgi:hypothetical protein
MFVPASIGTVSPSVFVLSGHPPRLVLVDVFGHNLAMPVTTVAFCKKWHAAMTQRSAGHFAADWEANRVIKELRRKTLFASASLDMMFADEIVREADVYEKHRRYVAVLNSVYAEADKLLRETENSLAGHARYCRKLPARTGATISDFFSRLAKSVASERKKFSDLTNKRWADALATYPLRQQDYEHRVWFMHDSSNPFQAAYDADLQRLIDRSDALPHTAKLIRGFDLDRRFQLHVAAILKRELPRLSKSTIASLVVLAYICAELVEVTGEGIRIPGTKRLLTPTGVYQKLKGVSLTSAVPAADIPA